MRRVRRHLAVVFALGSVVTGLAPACDQKAGASSAVIAGSVQGQSIAAESAVAHASGGFTLVISNKLDTCALRHTQSASELVITFSGASVAVPSTYAVADPATATTATVAATFTVVDANCNATVSASATAGTVAFKSSTVSTVATTPSTLTGTLDLTFGTDHLSGSFTAIVCGLASGIAGDGGLVDGGSDGGNLGDGGSLDAGLKILNDGGTSLPLAACIP